MRVMWLLALAAAAFGGTAAEPGRSVPCSDSIDRTHFPYRVGGYRAVLGAVSVPPPHIKQVEATGRRDWPYWVKSGLVVRARSGGVTVSVPVAWRDRAAIGWGNNDGVLFRQRIAGCPGKANVGFAYAGGFVLRARAGCLLLEFRVGGRSAFVRFGLGRKCR
jgi:hypothetical protein